MTCIAQGAVGISYPPRSHLPEDAAAQSALLAELEARPLLVLAARPGPGGVVADLAESMGGERLRLLSPAATEKVRALSESVRFLPKWSWKLSQTDMLLKGFATGPWQGMALLPAEGEQLVSYLDFCDRQARGEVEIGFCMTHPDWRGRGLMTRLLGSLLLLHFDRRFLVSTHESNQAMSRALLHFGFKIVDRRPNDRVNGETTLYLAREPRTAFAL